MTGDPNLLIGKLALGGLGVIAFWRFLAWIKNTPVKPDPWNAQVEQELSEAKEVCPHCSAEQPTTAWFCNGCGRAVGPYNNLMPYVQIFSEGEVFRNGRQFQNRPWVLAGYFLIFLGTFPLLAPIYLWSLLVNKKRNPGAGEPLSSPEPRL